jgi:lauroyl/myristoyl acyltransferase
VLGGDFFENHDPDVFWRAHVVHIGLTIIDLIRLPLMRDEELLASISIEGEELLRTVLAKGRGAAIFVNHLGSPIALGAGTGLRGYDITVVGNQLDIAVAGVIVPLQLMEKLLQRVCVRGKVKRALLGATLPAAAAATLRRNGLFAMFIDFPVVQKENEWLPFGAASMRVNCGPALLALRQRAEILCLHSVRVADNRHALKVATIRDSSEPMSDWRQSAREVTAAALRSLEAEVRLHPEQWWFWSWAQLMAHDLAC